MEPRAYSNLPVKANFAALNYTFTTGNIISDPASPIKELEINANHIIPGYVRTFALFGFLSRIQFSIPYTFLSGTAKLSGKDTSGTRSGFSDARLRFGINFFGSPPLEIKDFKESKNNTTVGASLVISIPTGQYYPEKLINLGTNRWGFKPEIGLSQKLSNWYTEIYSGIWFFTANNKFMNTKELQTGPLLTMQAHLNYVFNNKMWIGINGFYSYGGEVKTDGVVTGDKQDNYRFGATFSSPLSKYISVKLQYHSGAIVRAGSDFDFYGITIQYFWL